NHKGHEKTVKAMLGSNVQYTLDSAHQNEKIPTLNEVVERFPNTSLYLELKTDSARDKINNGLERRVVKLIQEKNLYDRVTVISFCPWSLVKTKRLDPKIKTGLDFMFPKLFKRHLQGLYLDYAKYILRVDSVHPPYEEVTPELVKKAQKRNLKI